MAKSDKRTLKAHRSWAAWGEQFGWRLYGTNDESAGHFFLTSGEEFRVTKEARNDIDERIEYLIHQPNRNKE